MKFRDPDGNNTTWFQIYLDGDFSALAENKTVIDAMMKWGKMTREQARSYIISGSGPQIILVDDNDPRSVNAVVDFPYKIYLSASMVKKFNSTAGRGALTHRTGNGKKVYELGLTLLEDIIQGHLALSQENPEYRRRSSPTVFNALTGFEQEVYGGILPDAG